MERRKLPMGATYRPFGTAVRSTSVVRGGAPEAYELFTLQTVLCLKFEFNSQYIYIYIT